MNLLKENQLILNSDLRYWNTDTTLSIVNIVENTSIQIPAHKIILAAYSDYFRKFLKDTLEINTSFDINIYKIIIDLMYNIVPQFDTDDKKDYYIIYASLILDFLLIKNNDIGTLINLFPHFKLIKDYTYAIKQLFNFHDSSLILYYNYYPLISEEEIELEQDMEFIQSSIEDIKSNKKFSTFINSATLLFYDGEFMYYKIKEYKFYEVKLGNTDLLVFSPSGKYLAYKKYKSVYIYDFEYKNNSTVTATDTINNLQWLNDDIIFAISNTQIFKIEDEHVIKSLSFNEKIYFTQIYDKKLFIVFPQRLEIYDVNDTLINVFNLHQKPDDFLIFNNYIFIVENKNLYIYYVNTLKLYKTIKMEHAIYKLYDSHYNNKIIISTDIGSFFLNYVTEEIKDFGFGINNIINIERYKNLYLVITNNGIIYVENNKVIDKYKNVKDIMLQPNKFMYK